MKPYVASHLKDMNRQVVYKLIREKKSTSKAEISKLTGISAPTVIKIINYLKDQNLIVEIGEGETSVGRKPQLLKLNTELMYMAAFFLEGEYLSMGVVDILGKVVYKKSVRIRPDFDYLIAMISDILIPRLMAEAQIPVEKLFGIGIALPVIYDQERQTISGAPIVADQEERHIGAEIRELEEKYHAIVMIENDANAQVLGEFVHTGCRADEDLILISMSTGMGAGVILGGKLRRGAHYMCGEIGYMSFAENFVSDRKNPGWLEAGIGYKKIQDRFDIQLTDTAEKLTDEIRCQIADYVAPTLAMCANNISLFLDSENVVLGGRMAEILGSAIIDRVNAYLDKHCITGSRIKLESTQDIGLIGIGALVTEQKMHEILTKDIE